MTENDKSQNDKSQNDPSSVMNDVDELVKDKIRNELDRNFLVQAVPGSGKTYNLVQRMIAIILSGRPANEIAAITFTRKAAEELHNRLREMIEGRYAHAAAYEKALLEQGLVDIEDGYVGTIHGFCARILREYPVEAKLDPAFIEIEEDDEKLFFKRTLSEILTANPEYLQPFAEHEVDPEEDMIVKGLQRFCQFPDVDFSFRGKVVNPDAKPLLNAIRESWSEAKTFDPRPHLDIEELSSQADQIKQWRNLEKLYGQLQRYFDKNDLNAEDLKAIRRSIRFYGNPKLTSLIDATAKDVLNGINQRIKEECQKFRDAYSLFLFPQVLPLLNKIREKEQDWRNQRGFVSYLDLLSRTVQLLKDVPHIRQAVQQKFRVLMIDEFQDTDPLQAEMAFLLAAENLEEKNWLKTRPRQGALFFVGDPKQSIYRFRRANINIYLKAASHLEKTGGEILILQQNRRSVASLCNWVNEAFAPVFAAQAKSGQAPFDKMQWLRDNNDQPAVKALELPGLIKGNATAQMAEYDSEKYAEIIAQLLENPEPAIKQGLPLSPDDFLILCRKNDELVKYALWLEEKGIGVNLSGGGPSLAETLQKDFKPLYWLLRALSDSNDASVIYAVLVGPIFGCSDEELYEYRKNAGILSCSVMPDGKSNVCRALRKMCLFRQWMQELVPGSAFRRIVSAIKYDAYLLLRDYGLLKTAFLGNITRLFDQSLFSRATDVLGNWVQSWPVDRSIDEPGKVNLLTVHKAKGLEAPVVLLGMTSQPRFHAPDVMIDKNLEDESQKSRGLLKLSYSFGPFAEHDFAVSPDWKDHLPDEEKAAKAEKLRLDYVACTRARDLLIMSRHHNKSGGVTSPLFKELSPAVDLCPEIEPVAVNYPEIAEDTAETAADELERWRADRRQWLKEKRRNKYEEENVTSLAEKAEKKFSRRGGGGGRALGVMVHSLLCNLLRWKIKKADDERIALLLERQLEEDARMKTRQELILQLLQNVLNSDLWVEAIKSAEAHTEVPFMNLVGGDENAVFLNGVIDLVFRLPDGWKIVDYKTNQVDSEAHRAELNNFYQGQLDLYAAHWEKLTGEKVLVKSLFYVRDSKEVQL